MRVPGDIILFADGEHHTAVLLRVSEEQSCMLFVTKNPYWGKVSRELTEDEVALLGYPYRGNSSYFVPVWRPNEYMIATGKSYPDYRVKELLEEFEEFI